MENNQSKCKSNNNINDVENTSKLQQWLENVWYKNAWGKLLLMPLMILYCAVNSLQRFKHRHDKIKLACPVIVVGNITVGGTGKTPLTVHIVHLLQQAGYKPAIITRGYGGQAQSWPQKVTAKSDPLLVGDEAVLMASRTQVPVYAGADRLQCIEAISKAHDCNVIISDDGMQHYKLPRDIQIAVLDGERMLGNGWCLPAGPLREKKQRLSACDLLVVNGEIAEHRRIDLANSTFFTMHLKGTMLINLVTHEQLALNNFSHKKVRAVTGIGNPQRFFNTLALQGDLQVEAHSFPDHHRFTEADFNFSDHLPVIMTEKDAVKCHRFAKDNFWMLPVSADFEGNFEKAILALMHQL